MELSHAPVVPSIHRSHCCVEELVFESWFVLLSRYKSSTTGPKHNLTPASCFFMTIIKVVVVLSLFAWSYIYKSQLQKTLFFFLLLSFFLACSYKICALTKVCVDSFSPEWRWSQKPRQQHRGHRETRDRGNRGLEVLRRFTEAPDQVHVHTNTVYSC